MKSRLGRLVSSGPGAAPPGSAPGSYRPRLRSILLLVLLVTLCNFGLLNLWYLVRSWQWSGVGSAADGSQGAGGQRPEFTVVWFYTENYAGKAARLEKSCRDLGIAYSFTKYIYNTSKPRSAHSLLSLKPHFILQKMHRHGTPIVFADSDLVFLKYPYMFTSNMSTEVDYMGVNWYVEWGLERGKNELLTSSGVSYWNTTPAAKQLLHSWHHALQCFDNVYAPDDQVLDAQFNAHFWMQRIRSKWLSLRGYLAINEWGLKTNETVIDHPDPNNVHEGHFHRPSTVPQWTLESGRLFQHHVLIGATCGADLEVANRPTANPRSMDLRGLNDNEEGDGRTDGRRLALGWRPNCTDFIVGLHLSLPKPIKAVRMQLNPLPLPPSGQRQRMSVKVRGYDPGKYEFVGCYNEHQQVRELNQFRGMDLEKNSPERCTAACSGFPYFGLQFTWECWCGETYGAYGAIANCSRGTVACPGNSAQNCGGALINAVYKKVVKEITSEFDLQTEWVEIDLTQIEVGKHYTFSFNGNLNSQLSIRSFLPVDAEPDAIVEYFDTLTEIDLFEHGDTIVHATNVVLGGRLVIHLRRKFVPPRGYRQLIFEHWNRRGEFASVEVDPPKPPFELYDLISPRYSVRLEYRRNSIYVVFDA